MNKVLFVLAAVIATVLGFQVAQAQDDTRLGFFITSSGPGDGANLGGLAGADRHCQTLAEAAGAGDRVWAAYLSADASGGQPAVNARDRIGTGPWYNAKGVLIARNADELHSDLAKLTKETSVTESGGVVNGRGDRPNRHDILTGSGLDGTVITGASCDNWTSNGAGGAKVGHHDRTGAGANPTSWNSAHDSRGCSQSNLQGTGGDGLFYCFAVS